jgi:hypothetical protein
MNKLIVFCVPFEEESNLNIIVTDDGGWETRMTVPQTELKDVGKLTRIVVPVKRDVRTLRIETNTMLTEIEAYPETGLRGREESGVIATVHPDSLETFETLYGLPSLINFALAFLAVLMIFAIAHVHPFRRPSLINCCARALDPPLVLGEVTAQDDLGKIRSLAPPPEPVPQLVAPPKLLSVRPRCLPRPKTCLPIMNQPRGQPCVKVLFASPLVRTTLTDVLAVPRLDIEAEVKCLSRLVLGAKSPFGLEACVATAEALRATLLDSRVHCLHFVTHCESGALVLEDGAGRAHMLDAATLQSLLSSHCTDSTAIQLVFLNSCSSFELGNVFFNAGIRAVICTKLGCSVRDDDAKYFMNTFYSTLFSGRTIQDSFGIAQTALMARPGATGDHFLLLSRNAAARFGAVTSSDEDSSDQSDDAGPSSSEPDDDVPRVQRMRDRGKVALTSLRDRMRVASKTVARPLPAPSGDFLGREVDIWALVTHLNKRRLVVLCGQQGTRSGIGKTAVAEEVSRWSTVRKMYSSVYFVDMQGRYTVDGSEDVWSGVYAVVRGGARRPAGLSAFQACEVELRRQGNVLLVLDQSDDVVRSEQFLNDVQSLLAGSSKLHLLIVSHNPVAWFGRYKAVHYGLRRLKDADATELFLRRAGRGLTREDFGLERSAPLDKASAKAALAKHPLQEFLDGHPRAITEAASKVTGALSSLNELVDMLSREGGSPHASSTFADSQSHRSSPESSDVENAARHM